MGVRDLFFAAMRREKGGYVPFEFSLCPHLLEVFRQKTGRSDYAAYYGFPVRAVGVECTITDDRFTRYFPKIAGQDGFSFSRDWGVGCMRGHFAHFSRRIPPMAHFESVDDIARYPFPDPQSDYDWAGMPDRVRAVKEADLIAMAPLEATIFETSWYLRGMEAFLQDMCLDPGFVEYLLDRVCEIRCAMARGYALAGCDVLRLGDDVSTQLDMMISPEQYIRLIKPRLERVIRAAKAANPRILIFYHGDGNLQKIIPDLIEVGVEILNPIQPECMNPVEIKRRYGGRLSFWGTLGTQTTLPFGSPGDVKNECLRMIKEVGFDGGLFLAPSHMLEPEVPFENIEAFIDTVVGYNAGLVRP